MKIALFSYVHSTYSYEAIMIYNDGIDGEGGLGRDHRYVQKSEWVEVDLPMLAKDEVIAKSIDALDKMKAEIVEEYEGKLLAIKQEKAKLLALPNLESAA